MKQFQVLSFLIFASILFASCCTKQDKCSLLTFNQLQLHNFTKDDLSEQVQLMAYKGGTNMTTLSGTYIYSPAINKEDTTIATISTSDLSVADDYQLLIPKTGVLYTIRNFSVDRVACGKCFMRSNSQFGYELVGYSVGGVYRNYEGAIQVFK